MNIRIKNNQKKRNLSTPRIRTRLSTLLRTAGLPDAELSVLFIGDRAMRTLNRRYRAQDRTTDVLSFSLREGQFPDIQPRMLGDIVIAVPVAVRQAREEGHTFAREIDRLLVHGLAHLLGYDHECGPREALRMNKMEQRLLKSLSA